MPIPTELMVYLKDRKILVVDDERFSRTIVARAFTEVETVQATNGGEALAELVGKSNQYAAVICDFNMPIMDGLRFLKAVRTGLEGIRHSLPVLMLTGNSDSGLVKGALALDVDAFVVKPVAIGPLYARLRHVLSNKPDLKSPQHYGAINIEELSAQLLSVASAMSAPANKPKEEPPPPDAEKLAISAVLPGAVLAQDIRAPAGQVLVAAGATMSERLLERLKDLIGMGVCPTEAWIVR
jgi:two-component system, chemotaxis family, chemotaxis protein CheY